MRRAFKEARNRSRLPWQTTVVREPELKLLASLQSTGLSREGQDWYAASTRLLPWMLGLGVAAAWNESHCESSTEHSRLTDVRRRVLRAWNEVVNDLDRLEATLPLHFSMPRTRSPDIKMKGRQISIQFKVAPGIKFPDLLMNIMTELGSHGSGRAVRHGELSIEVAECGAAQVISLRKPSSPGTLIQLHIPTAPEQTAEVEFLFDAEAPISEDDMKAVASVLRSANGIRQHSGSAEQSRYYSRSFSGEAGTLDAFTRHLGAVFGEEVRGLNGPFDSIVRELERLAFPPAMRQEGLAGKEEDEEYTHGRRQEEQPRASTSASGVDYGSPQANAAVQRLEKLGAVVYPPGSKDAVDWGVLAGYEEQKEQISETLLLALLHPDVYDEVSNKTRKQKASNRPRAVLFEGPPGCGKTTSARVLATQASSPLVYVPIEAIASKWYGESEKNLGGIFEAAEELDGCLIFLDEIDSLATQRSSEMHEATRRILGVLLRQLDGFEGKRSIVIGATNRKQDLDPALLSRFDTSILFQLPSQSCRQQILQQYAQQLCPADLERLAEACQGFSGRDLRDVCEQAERRTASEIIKSMRQKASLPCVEDYLEAASARQRSKATDTPPALLGIPHPRNGI